MAPTAQQIPLAKIAANEGIPVDTLRRWVREGRIQATRIGPRKLYLDPAEVAKLKTPVGAAPVALTPASYIEKVLAEAPPLTDEQCSRLAELLRPARRTAAEAVRQQAA